MALIIVYTRPSTEIVEGFLNYSSHFGGGSPNGGLPMKDLSESNAIASNADSSGNVVSACNGVNSGSACNGLSACNACPPSWAYPSSQPKPLEMMVGVSGDQCQSFWIV